MSPRNVFFSVTSLFVLGCSAEPTPVEDATVIEIFTDAGNEPSEDAAVPYVGPDATVGDTGGSPSEPAAPDALTRWLTGADADAVVAPRGPGLILMGGGREPDAAFQWWVPLLSGGDVVVLRASGSDGYNDYLFEDIGGVDSVETLLVDSASLADDPYVAWRVDHAEGVFLAGGNQWDYLSLWRGTGLQAALQRVYGRGAVLGGTSAGLAVLGGRAFSAENDTVYSEEALADPFNELMRFEDAFLKLPPLTAVITDSHFRERDRMGRLVAFVARMWGDGETGAIGIGVDESTALLIGPEGREVVGAGSVYEVRGTTPPSVLTAGRPLTWNAIDVSITSAVDQRSTTLEVVDGVLAPADPY